MKSTTSTIQVLPEGRHAFVSLSELPSKTPESEAMSKDLGRRGFAFVGPTVCYAFMQAAGLVNDHLVGCFRYDQVVAPG